MRQLATSGALSRKDAHDLRHTTNWAAAVKGGLLVACLALAALQGAQSWAQLTGPHTYDNTPVGTNQIELAYSYSRANASIATALVITGASLNLNTGTIDFTRYLGIAHHMAWVAAGVPVAGLGGAVAGSNIRGSVTGAGDSSTALPKCS